MLVQDAAQSGEAHAITRIKQQSCPVLLELGARRRKDRCDQLKLLEGIQL